MCSPLMYQPAVQRLIQLALEEDIGSGDVTTDTLVEATAAGHAVIVAKEELTVAGLDIARTVFRQLDPDIDWQPEITDGQAAVTGQTVVSFSGRMAAMLTAERTALNFLQRMSGIATQVKRYIGVMPAGKARLVDTRKTTPGWRVLEKYAVRMGGGTNHRMGLYDGVLIKDNHIAACGGIAAAVAAARSKVSHLVKIEVEAESLQQVEAALGAGPDIIMLDNMNPEQIRQAVDLIDGRALVEISGGVRIEDLPGLAVTGVDLISCGALTHGARAVDLSMRLDTAD